MNGIVQFEHIISYLHTNIPHFQPLSQPQSQNWEATSSTLKEDKHKADSCVRIYKTLRFPFSHKIELRIWITQKCKWISPGVWVPYFRFLLFEVPALWPSSRPCVHGTCPGSSADLWSTSFSLPTLFPTVCSWRILIQHNLEIFLAAVCWGLHSQLPSVDWFYKATGVSEWVSEWVRIISSQLINWGLIYCC